ncbi:phosphohistidine phosphatase [Streptomyces nigrescens]|uniref:Phosphohistidine phosphatase n=2 Tax=Streptomyces TaxID=1883 RepID=A0ABM7ZVC2_STRNI|nr:histidine phosphatase family protein [Streptomyces nigrescens]MEE4419340.1 histidine phosphatase family protein [Streptomyces sp. DSM 41528]BDM70316.1 phosphohistidine phosphatase [Streptomyces nigrescens]
MTPPLPARLVVLRHAKSAWPPDVPDHERPLGKRGRRDAPAAGRRLLADGCVPDLVLCSTARRTRETWDLVAPELGARPEVVFEPRVYGASAAELLDVVREVPEQRRTVLLIGHQPGVQDVVLALAGQEEGERGRDADGEALGRVRAKFPTSGIAVLALRGAWADLAPGTATLTDFTVPRGEAPGK